MPVTPGDSGSYVVPLVDYRIEMNYLVPPTVIVYRGGMELTGGSSGTGFNATGNLGIGTVAADTDSATPEGLPWQINAKLANFVSNFELGDGVADDGPPPPTPTLTALAAPGRNPAATLISIPTGSEDPQVPPDPDYLEPYKVSRSGPASTAADEEEIRGILKELIEKSPKFRKLFEELQRGENGLRTYNFRYKYVISGVPFGKNLEQFDSGLAGKWVPPSRDNSARGFYALITIYKNHPELQYLPPALRKRFLMDLIIHETIHAYRYNHPKTDMVDDAPDPTGKGGPADTATLQDWMNELYPLDKIPDKENRDKLRDWRRQNYGNLDIGEKSRQYIRDVLKEVDDYDAEQKKRVPK